MKLKTIIILIITMLSACLGTLSAQDIDSGQVSTLSEGDYLELTKSPTGACLRSLALPGWGQLYVEHYYHAPVFFAGAGFLWYNIINNHIDYNNYKSEMNKLTDKESYEYQVAHSRMEAALDNRDLSILYIIGVYVLSIIDAYSGAHLYDFKILNNDFQLKFNPANDVLGKPNLRIGVSWQIGTCP